MPFPEILLYISITTSTNGHAIRDHKYPLKLVASKTKVRDLNIHKEFSTNLVEYFDSMWKVMESSFCRGYFLIPNTEINKSYNSKIYSEYHFIYK